MALDPLPVLVRQGGIGRIGEILVAGLAQDDGLIDLLLRFRWWDRSIEEINSLIPLLTCSDLELVRKELEALL